MSDTLKTYLWRTLVTAAFIIVIGACFYSEENSRGVTAWQKCEREVAAHGDSLDWKTFIPAPVPDEKNFFKAPMMTEWFVKGAVSHGPNLLPTNNPETTAEDITASSASNYVAWCAAFEPGFDRIRVAVQRPLAQVEGDYVRPFKGPQPNFISYRNVTQALAHRAKCHLVLGEPDEALVDLTLLHHLNQTLVQEHKALTLVDAMIHVAIAGLYEDAVAYGLDSRAWREPQLAALQAQLADINLLPEVAYSFRGERAGVNHLLDTLTPDELMRAVYGTHRQVSDLGWWLMPSGWIYQNKVVVVTLETKLLEAIDTAGNTVSPFKAEVASTSINREFEHATPFNFIAAICVPNFTKASMTMARNQTLVDQARVVCALERYRLAHEKYPAALTALVPEFIATLPHDIIGGKPLNYSRRDDWNFRLYSVGWNETDNGGVTAWSIDGHEDRERGDWVWHYPQK